MTLPIDYSIDVANPFQSLTQGFGAGAGIRQVLDQRELAQQQAAAQAQMRADLGALAAKKDATGADYAGLITKYPQLSEQLKRGWDVQNEAQKAADISFSSQVHAALMGGATDVAKKILVDRGAAVRNAGDERKAKAFEDLAQLVDLDPNTARLMSGARLASIMGPDKFATTFQTLGDEARKAALAPAEQATKEAEARIKGVEATNAAARGQAELFKMGADLGLTQAQTAKTLKETEKLSAEIQKAALELGGGGTIEPEKRFDFESKLRKEYSAQTQGFQDVQEAYRRVKASKNDAPGDLSLIFGFMKMLDPGSVVREGEFANAQNAAGVPERVLNIYNRLMSGERLSDSQRKGFIGQAESLMNAAKERERTVRAGIDQVVKSYRLNPDNVFYEPEAGKPDAPAGGAPAAVPQKYQGRSWTKY